MLKKFYSRIGSGILIIILGATIYFPDNPSIYGFSVPRHSGFLIIICGIFWIGYVITYKKQIIIEDQKLAPGNRFVICPSCLKPFHVKDVPDYHCPKCNISLEELEGFYDKHPDLKHKKKLKNNQQTDKK